MWTIIKIKTKLISQFQIDLKNKLDKNYIIYNPKLLIQKYKNNKLMNKKFNLLGDYLFCFHADFNKVENLDKIKFCRGLRYVLPGFQQTQKEIEEFVTKCKKFEDKFGYLSNTFYDINIQNNYRFNSGPFSEKIFKILNLQKNKIDILLGNIKTSINRKKFIFSPL